MPVSFVILHREIKTNILSWGVSEATAEQIRRSHAVTPFTAMQSEYSMMARQWEKNVIPLCAELGIGFVAYSPMAGGLLSGKYTAQNKYEGDYIRRVISRFKPENVKANCGVYALTVNIIIFPKLGSMQTVLMPMLGQISMGLLIDHFGLLRSQVHTFGWLRAVSLVLILTGVIMVVLRRGEKNSTKQATLLWQFIGFSGGAIYAMQPPMNGLLAGSLSSSLYAALITFLTATFMLTITVLFIRSNRICLPQIFSHDCPWWSWMGGIIGGTFVTGFAFFGIRH